MNPKDIPATITRLIYGDPIHRGQLKISQNDIARSLAHYWPAIEQHIRRQIAQQIEAAAPNRPNLSATLAAMQAGYEAAARIAAGNKHQPIATDITPDGDAHDQNNHDAYTL